jgi:hypothetical protein
MVGLGVDGGGLNGLFGGPSLPPQWKLLIESDTHARHAIRTAFCCMVVKQSTHTCTHIMSRPVPLLSRRLLFMLRCVRRRWRELGLGQARGAASMQEPGERTNERRRACLWVCVCLRVAWGLGVG